MFTESITKKRVAAAVVTLSIGGAGLAMSGFGGESSAQMKAGKAGKPSEQAANVPTALDDAINGDHVRLVARHTGFGHFTLEWATAASKVAAATNEVGSAILSAVDTTSDQAARPRGTRVPRKLEVTLPSYDGGRPPSASAPSVEPGTAPSVEPGWTTTVDLGEAPRIGSPSVDPGGMGTMHPPTAHVS